MNWEPAIQRIEEHVVKIETPSAYGTGFLAFYNMDKTACGIATAAHVVQHADEWLEPIKIRNNSGVIFLNASDRYMFIDDNADSAIIFFLKGNLNLPELPITLRPIDFPCGIGSEIGWVGYPVIDPYTLCFFSGTISARKASERAYNIDGVAINGVSGGPVFHLPNSDSNDMQIIGTISAYRPNMSLGQPLPGLAQARDVSHFHYVAEKIESIDQANAEKQQLEARGQAGTAPQMIHTEISTNNNPSS